MKRQAISKLLLAEISAPKEYVVTRLDRNTMRSVAIAGPFIDLGEAVAEAVRMNDFAKYRDQFLMVDLAASVPVRRVITKAVSAPCR